MLAAKAHQVILRKPQLVAQRAKVLLNQVGVEAVVAGGHRSVGGKDHFAGNLARGGVEVHAFFLHAAANGLEDREAAVALVQMQNSGRDAHRLQGAKSAHAEQQFLANARASVAAIEAGGQFAILGRIALHVGVEQQKVAAAHLDSPHLGADRAAAGLNLHRRPVRRSVPMAGCMGS